VGSASTSVKKLPVFALPFRISKTKSRSWPGANLDAQKF
jgi:hypothetical protein